MGFQKRQAIKSPQSGQKNNNMLSHVYWGLQTMEVAATAEAISGWTEKSADRSKSLYGDNGD
ncbi:hypothetical protein QKW35_19825 [Pontibacterium granulatum]|uniref:hypothetical protein n=1 Tax=Pontibacterium granulatum TaxID=2036029 RepID=UPI00249BA8FF|nr:hypothetical protein [Pontibacterium granulatum]MDI3326630.1 hypothetical protein [Pontibacterium granulatum]